MQSELTWDSIAQTYLPDIRAYVKYLGCDGACADDVVQDILIRLNALLEEGRLTGELRTLHGIIQEVCRSFVKNALRKNRRASKVGATTHDGELNPAVNDEEQDLDQTRSEAEILPDLINTLPTHLREVIDMRISGLSLQTISGILGISLKATDKRRRSAVNMMRRQVQLRVIA